MSSSSEHPDRDQGHIQVPHIPVEIDKEKLKKAFDVSHFDLNAVLRGIQLTLVGGERLSLPSLAWQLMIDDICSSQGSPEPRRLHLRTLQASSHSCGLWYRHSRRHSRSGMYPLISPAHAISSPQII